MGAAAAGTVQTALRITVIAMDGGTMAITMCTAVNLAGIRAVEVQIKKCAETSEEQERQNLHGQHGCSDVFGEACEY